MTIDIRDPKYHAGLPYLITDKNGLVLDGHFIQVIDTETGVCECLTRGQSGFEIDLVSSEVKREKVQFAAPLRVKDCFGMDV